MPLNNYINPKYILRGIWEVQTTAGQPTQTCQFELNKFVIFGWIDLPLTVQIQGEDKNLMNHLNILIRTSYSWQIWTQISVIVMNLTHIVSISLCSQIFIKKKKQCRLFSNCWKVVNYFSLLSKGGKIYNTSTSST